MQNFGGKQGTFIVVYVKKRSGHDNKKYILTGCCKMCSETATLVPIPATNKETELNPHVPSS